MRIILLLTLILGFNNGLIAQNPELLSKKQKKALPGVLPILSDFLYMDKAEISNQDWKEFLTWLNLNDTALLKKMEPNTKVWETDNVAFGEQFVKYYFQHPAYNAYPVVGINYNQAVAYCKWRTERVMETEAFKKSPISKMVYRLPTEEEWRHAAWGNMPEGSPWPWEGENPKFENAGKKTGVARLNYSIASWNQGGAENLNTMEYITAPVISYWPNFYGLHNMVGNIAEWTANKTTLGGSWRDFAPQCYITAPKPVLPDTFNSNTIGFRCLLEILEFKPENNIKPIDINAKYLQKCMVYLPDTGIKKLFAFRYETTQEEFITFLNGNRQFKIQHELWTKYVPYTFYQTYAKHKAYSKYPVVNISHQAALAYCQWLTNIYNNSSKRKFKKVKFKLPTMQEWLLAANNNQSNKYGIEGENYRNKKGLFLYNFSPDETKIKDNTTFFSQLKTRSVDGSAFIAPSISYYKNKLGLYHCSGNVAEMLENIGECDENSWVSTAEEIKLKAPVEKYENASPTIGFRVFMEVVEEK